ncbi:MAG: hypothetical protein HY544_01130 [Candidatus Diapherotrites archaeon]|uniref:Uncharacterized protein n=1 Tax=Candidatus Iainarchaeum sp. TaxID=3101447 RepID=A0A8T3YJ69_9ARCH|nr:hypothetical protein [Candidatus Diapherotrites archaeon]
MKNGFLAFLFCLFLSGSGFAVSGNEAVNYVVNSSRFIYEGESYTPPNVAIEFEGKGYWVIPIASGSSVITYFAVDSSSGKLSVSRAVNRGLFGVADNLRELQLLKASITPSSGVEWVFTQNYRAIFSEMSLQLGDEVYQLNTVQTALQQESISVDMSGLKAQLVSMAGQASSISEKISAAAVAENDFFTKPSGENLGALKSAYAGVTASISQLNSAALAYNSSRNALKNQISVADIDAQTKGQMLSTLDTPPSLQKLGNYNLYSIQVQDKISSAFQSSTLRADSLLDEFDRRIAKNEADSLIFGQSERVKQATGFNSLSEAQAAILSKESRLKWEDQAKVRDLEHDYQSAVDFYSNKRDFAQAKKFALLAADDAIAVYRAGERKSPPGGGISQDTLFKLAGLLLVVLVLLYAFNNRGKLKEAISRGPEEVDVYGN